MNDALGNYFGLDEDYSAPESARVAVIPVPYEATTTYGKGTRNGPRAILEASQQVELFDDELWIEPYKIGIQTVAPVEMEPVTAATQNPFSELREIVSRLVTFGKFPIILGGEHSLTLGAVAACADKYSDLSVLQIDAHADLRRQYEDNPYNHACVSYHIYRGLPEPLMTQVGIRNLSKEEAEWLEQEKPRINIFWARHQERWGVEEIIASLSEHVYLTIDVDGFDCGIMPSTGTPEPGGLTWNQVTSLIKHLCVKKTVVAADIVELAPIEKLVAPDFLVAKLLYKIIGYRFALDLGVTKKYV